MEIIEISEGIAELKSITTTRRVKLSDFKEALLQASGVRTPILPANTIFYAAKESTKIYLIEKEPALVRILYSADRDPRERAKEYTLSFPYHYFLVDFKEYAFENCRFFFRNQRITRPEDVLCYPPIPNLHSSCTVCLGTDFKYQITADLPAKISNVVEYFFRSTFNTDLPDLFTKKIPRQIAALKRQNEHTFDAWQRLNLTDISSVAWLPYQSLAKCVDDLLGGDD